MEALPATFVLQLAVVAPMMVHRLNSVHAILHCIGG
jgi:hypothetical protein